MKRELLIKDNCFGELEGILHMKIEGPSLEVENGLEVSFSIKYKDEPDKRSISDKSLTVADLDYLARGCRALYAGRRIAIERMTNSVLIKCSWDTANEFYINIKVYEEGKNEPIIFVESVMSKRGFLRVVKKIEAASKRYPCPAEFAVKEDFSTLLMTRRDLQLFGHTMFEDNGMLNIVCPYAKGKNQMDILCKILECFGITQKPLSFKYNSLGLDDDIEYMTNLPYQVYKTEYDKFIKEEQEK